MLLTESDSVIPLKRIARSLGLSAATISKMSARGAFPAPINLGVRKKLYLLSEVEEWWHGRFGRSFPLAPEAPDDHDLPHAAAHAGAAQH